MNFQRARTEAQILERKQEIISACRAIYLEQGYEAVNIKAIAERTSFTRPAIYTYFETIEEMLLELLRQEFKNWGEELQGLYRQNVVLSKQVYCELMSKSLAHNEFLLDLAALHMRAIENNSRMERVVSFKQDLGALAKIFYEGLERYFPNSSQAARHAYFRDFFSYVFGIFLYTHITPKQREALQAAGSQGEIIDFQTACYEGLLLLSSQL